MNKRSRLLLGRRLLCGIGIYPIRREVGVTQADMADRLGVAQPTYATQERNDNMRIGTLRRIVGALGGVLKMQVEIDGRDYPLGFSSAHAAMSEA